ncbi:MAG: aldo/keto reductase [Paracoccaceae bacterium]|jgi:aryl-alcohol dehydrogenase-like predicted oxidoreductase
MKLRKLGKLGPDISPIGVGAMSFSNFYGTTTETQSHRILHAALAQGISHIDTANVYGMGVSEAAIGNFLTQNKASAAGKFTLATKAGIRRDSETGNNFFDNSAKHLAEELDKSLQRLKVETIDLFYVHRRDANRPIEEVTQTLASFIKAGKIRSFGFSEIAPSSLKKASEIHHVAAVQSEYSLSVRSPELGLVQATKHLGTALVAFSPLGRSLLTDRPHTTQKIATMGFLKSNPRFIEPNLSANIEATAKFRALAAEMGTSAAALSIAWLLHQSEHIIAIPGTRSVPHFLEHCAGARLNLSKEDIAQIESILPVGWAHGDRYSQQQWIGPERYC